MGEKDISEAERSTIQVGILAPSAAIRAGLHALLSAFEGLDIVVERASFAELTSPGTWLDVLVATADSLSMVEIQEAFQDEDEYPALLLVTDEPGATEEMSAFPWRAWGMLSIDATEEEFLAAIQALHRGLLVGDRDLLKPLFPPQFLAGEELPAMFETLTGREIEVLQYVAQGLANKQIGLAMGISEHTVKFHISSIYAKLGVSNRTEAVRRGVRLGLIAL
jgi:DNA-binding NarL/FixJ family response regulator